MASPNMIPNTPKKKKLETEEKVKKNKAYTNENNIVIPSSIS